MGKLVDRVHRELTDEDIFKIVRTYYEWRFDDLTWPGEAERAGSTLPAEPGSQYKDIPGFCKSATLEEIRQHGHVLTPGRYVGAAAQEDDGEPFEEKMKRLSEMLREQMTQASKLDDAIEANLKELGYGG
jgi:type I restriction enzyme M protein